MMRKLASFLVAMALLALPVMGQWVCPPEDADEIGCVPCPPASTETIYMCVDGQAVPMVGRFSAGVMFRGPYWTVEGASNYWHYRPFVRVGYEHPIWTSMFIRSGLSISNPFTPLCTNYVVDLSGKYHLTDNLSVLAGLEFDIMIDMGATDWARVAMNVGAHYGFGGLDPGLGIYLIGQIPAHFSAADPLFGMMFMGGLEFRF